MALILAGILWGALGVQYIAKEEPCPLCYLQRLGMLGVASGVLMNVRWGVRKRHYGLSLFSAVFGGFVALRQFFLHVCPGYPKFGEPVFGLNLYTWSFIIFSCCIAYISLLFLLFPSREKEESAVTWFGHLSFILVFLIALANIFAILLQCGLGPCQ